MEDDVVEYDLEKCMFEQTIKTMSVIWFMCCFFYVASKDSHLSLALLICVSMVLYSSYCHPTFKEPSLDPNNIKNYCPIFLSSFSVQSI